MASKTMPITVPAFLPPSSSDGAEFAAVGRLLRTLNAATASADTSKRRSRSATEREIAGILDRMRIATASPHVVTDTISATVFAFPPAEYFATSSGNTSDPEKLSKSPESEEIKDEFWLKEYAESHRKRPGSSAVRRLDKRLLVLQRHNARRKSSAAAIHRRKHRGHSSNSLSSNSDRGEHRRNPPGSASSLSRESRIFRGRCRKAFPLREFSLLPANSHRCRRPEIHQGARQQGG